MKGGERKMKRFWVHFVGTKNGKWINAKSMKRAKELFAEVEGVLVSPYIVASKKQT
jgi:hypothetical protein